MSSRKISSENPTSRVSTQTTDLPLIPPKKLAISQQSAVPPADVVFELENVPMPSPTTSEFCVLENNAESVPIKVSSHSFPLLQLEQGRVPSEVETLKQIMPPFTPTLPEVKSTFLVETPSNSIEPTAAVNVLPPLPPKAKVNMLIAPQEIGSIPLPPKDPGPPSFTPLPPCDSPVITHSAEFAKVHMQKKEPPLPDFAPPPPPTRISSLPSGNSPTAPEAEPTVVAAEINDFPPLPPKQLITPPPPPPITPNEYPHDSPHEFFSGSESDEECPLMSIQSSRNTDDSLLDFQVSHNVSESSSSMENSPLHQPIRQQLTGLKSGANAIESDLKMLITPHKEGDDYMNQEVIDQIMEDDEDQDEVRVGQPLTVKGTGGVLTNDLELQVSNGHHDYINSGDLTNELLDDDDDEEEQLGTQRLTIRSTLPRQSETDKDYENQEVLDIIPLVTVTTNPVAPHDVNILYLGNDHAAGASTESSSIYDSLSSASQPLINSTSSVHPAKNDTSVHNRDSMSVTFPRTKSDAGYLREYSDGASSVSTTPGSDTLGMESGISLVKGSSDYFDGVILLYRCVKVRVIGFYF